MRFGVEIFGKFSFVFVVLWVNVGVCFLGLKQQLFYFFCFFVNLKALRFVAGEVSRLYSNHRQL